MLSDQSVLCPRVPLIPTVGLDRPSLQGEPNLDFDDLSPRRVLSDSYHNPSFQRYYLCHANRTGLYFNHLDMIFGVRLISVCISSLPLSYVNSDQLFDLFDPHPFEKGNYENSRCPINVSSGTLLPLRPAHPNISPVTSGAPQPADAGLIKGARPRDGMWMSKCQTRLVRKPYQK